MKYLLKIRNCGLVLLVAMWSLVASAADTGQYTDGSGNVWQVAYTAKGLYNLLHDSTSNRIRLGADIQFDPCQNTVKQATAPNTLNVDGKTTDSFTRPDGTTGKYKDVETCDGQGGRHFPLGKGLLVNKDKSGVQAADDPQMREVVIDGADPVSGERHKLVFLGPQRWWMGDIFIYNKSKFNRFVMRNTIAEGSCEQGLVRVGYSDGGAAGGLSGENESEDFYNSMSKEPEDDDDADSGTFSDAQVGDIKFSFKPIMEVRYENCHLTGSAFAEMWEGYGSKASFKDCEIELAFRINDYEWSKRDDAKYVQKWGDVGFGRADCHPSEVAASRWIRFEGKNEIYKAYTPIYGSFNGENDCIFHLWFAKKKYPGAFEIANGASLKIYDYSLTESHWVWASRGGTPTGIWSTSIFSDQDYHLLFRRGSTFEFHNMYSEKTKRQSAGVVLKELTNIVDVKELNSMIIEPNATVIFDMFAPYNEDAEVKPWYGNDGAYFMVEKLAIGADATFIYTMDYSKANNPATHNSSSTIEKNSNVDIFDKADSGWGWKSTSAKAKIRKENNLLTVKDFTVGENANVVIAAKNNNYNFKTLDKQIGTTAAVVLNGKSLNFMVRSPRNFVISNGQYGSALKRESPYSKDEFTIKMDNLAFWASSFPQELRYNEYEDNLWRISSDNPPQESWGKNIDGTIKGVVPINWRGHFQTGGGAPYLYLVPTESKDPYTSITRDVHAKWVASGGKEPNSLKNGQYLSYISTIAGGKTNTPNEILIKYFKPGKSATGNNPDDSVKLKLRPSQTYIYQIINPFGEEAEIVVESADNKAACDTSTEYRKNCIEINKTAGTITIYEPDKEMVVGLPSKQSGFDNTYMKILYIKGNEPIVDQTKNAGKTTGEYKVADANVFGSSWVIDDERTMAAARDAKAQWNSATKTFEFDEKSQNPLSLYFKTK